MINLYIFNEFNRAAVYGIGTYICELKKALKESLINITIIHLQSPEFEIKTEKKGDIDIWHIPAPSVKGRMFHNMYKSSDRYYMNIAYLLRTRINNTGNIIFHFNYTQSSVLGYELKKYFNAKFICTVHYLHWGLELSGNILLFKHLVKDAKENGNDKKLKELGFYSEQKYLALADKVVCLAKSTASIVEEDYGIDPSKITVIYNGLSDNRNNTDRKTLLEKYGLPNVPIFLFAGRLDVVKGLKHAIRAFNHIKQTYPECHFIIAGNGDYDIYFKECKNNWASIHFTGLLEKSLLYELYSIANIGVMPSLHEQCSYVAIEMMMHGIPVITSNSTGLHEMTEDGETGLQISVIESLEKVRIRAAELAEKMLLLLDNPDMAKSIGEKARKRYEKIYSADVMRNNLIKLYNSLY